MTRERARRGATLQRLYAAQGPEFRRAGLQRRARHPSADRRSPEGSKLLRFLNQTPRIEAGEVVLLDDAPWLAMFEKEIMGFPGSKHDDQADVLAQLLAWSGNRRELPIPVGPQLFNLDGTPLVSGDDEDDSWWESEERYVVRE